MFSKKKLQTTQPPIKQAVNKQGEIRQPTILFKNGYIYVAGGLASCFSDQITRPFVGKSINLSETIPTFITSSYTQVITDNYKEYLRKKLNLPLSQSWKMGILAGALISITKTFITIVNKNMKEYHKNYNQNNEKKVSIIMSTVDLLRTKGLNGMLKGYFNKLHSDIFYLVTYQGFREYNGYLSKKYFLQGQPSLPRQLAVGALIGFSSSVEATLISKPIELVSKNLTQNEEVSFDKIHKGIVSSFVSKVPKTAVKLPIYAQLKQKLPLVYSYCFPKLN
ncbi:hypothetical protein M0811_12764 [Anaeramoeba ignava]|uniref:Mitochondrial carrier protein n=1 Tax=Anaeramoeba ignava TaxID=1746090 RepID=A0A9Q0L7V1_ANAIG|nr:hypothetical protein M0811_12764 [Anaeramoeba ignava]